MLLNIQYSQVLIKGHDLLQFQPLLINNFIASSRLFGHIRISGPAVCALPGLKPTHILTDLIKIFKGCCKRKNYNLQIILLYERVRESEDLQYKLYTTYQLNKFVRTVIDIGLMDWKKIDQPEPILRNIDFQ